MIRGGDDRGRGGHHRRAQRHRRRARQVRRPCPSARSTARRSRSRAGTTVIEAAEQLGIHIPHFCWHPDLPGRRQLPHVPGRDREDAEAPDRLQHAGDATAWWSRPSRPKARRGPPHDARVPARQPPDRLPRLRPGRRVLPAGQLHGARPPRLEGGARGEGPASARSWTSGRSCSTPSAACCARAASASSSEVTGTNSLEFVNRGDHTQIATFENRPISPRLRRQPGRRLPGGRAARPTTSASRCASGS